MDDATADLIGRTLAERRCEIVAIQFALRGLMDLCTPEQKNTFFAHYVGYFDALQVVTEKQERLESPLAQEHDRMQRKAMDGLLDLLMR